ncbi:glutathione S-transferase [Oceanicola sp. 22II-s10i]|nr:glutathione S-transferase [Oceanicola sp. 22II-s10i]
MSFDGATLYVSVGPNPRLVRMFLAEKGVTIPEQVIDLRGGENRRAPYLEMNPGGQMPALRLASGQVIAETVPICEYVEDVAPEPAFIGPTSEERAETRMWVRRVEQLYVRPMIDAYRYGHALALFGERMRCIPEATPELKSLARDGEAWIETNMVGPFLAGDRMSLADIIMYCMMDFAEQREVLTRDPSLVKLPEWFDRMAARPSAESSRALAY